MTLPLNDRRFPPRLIDLCDPGDDAIRELLRAAQIVATTPDLQRHLIERRLRSANHVRAGLRVGRMQLVTLIAILLGFGGVVGAAAYRHLRLVESPKHERVGRETGLARTGRTSTKTSPHGSPMKFVGPPTPVALPSHKPRALAMRSLPNFVPVRAEVAVPSSEAPSEQQLLSKGLQYLRIKNDPVLAIEALDAYDKTFTSGALGPESKALRVEALVMMGRKQEAVAVLSSLLAQPLPGSESRRVLRGELNVALGDYGSAVQELSVALAAGVNLDASTTERALWARSVAHQHLGNFAAAAKDIDDYLHRFPAGRFAALARLRQGK